MAAGCRVGTGGGDALTSPVPSCSHVTTHLYLIVKNKEKVTITVTDPVVLSVL
jgi:hypothetical protein